MQPKTSARPTGPAEEPESALGGRGAGRGIWGVSRLGELEAWPEGSPACLRWAVHEHTAQGTPSLHLGRRPSPGGLLQEHSQVPASEPQGLSQLQPLTVRAWPPAGLALNVQDGAWCSRGRAPRTWLLRPALCLAAPGLWFCPLPPPPTAAKAGRVLGKFGFL